MIYFNRETGATIEMSQKAFDRMNSDYKKRWREATASEIDIYEKRAKQKKLIKKHNDRRVKANEKAEKERAAKLNRTAQKESKQESKDTSADNNKKGTSGDAKSDGAN